MAKLTIDELKNKAKDILGDRTDDDALSFLEDLNDTISTDEATNDNEWKKKYEALEKDKDELDKAWRQRYRDRFFSADSHTDDETKPKDTNPANNAHKTTDDIDLEEQAKNVRFDDLFTKQD